MLIPFIGLLLGILLGLNLPYQIPMTYVNYTAIAILAGLDAVFGGLRAQLDDEFVFFKFITSFFVNTALAAFLVFLGDLMGVNINIGAVVAFSIRIFRNLSLIREQVFERICYWHTAEKDKRL